MPSFQDIPLQRKLTQTIVLSCMAVLVLACGILAGYEWMEFRGALVRDMGLLADVLGQETQGALAFDDASNAGTILQTLRAEPNVVAAAVYSADGRSFARYARQPGASLPAAPGPDGYAFRPAGLSFFRPIVLNGRRIGTIYLEVDLNGVRQRLRVFFLIGGGVLLGSALVALFLSSRFQRPIARPILSLAETARIVAERKDFTVRATAGGWREITLLTRAFNQMLAGIETGEGALRSANESLRQEVAERKGAEARAQAQLARLEMLQRITRSISERLDLNSIFQVASRMLEENLPADFCCVALFDGTSDLLAIASVGSGHPALDLSGGIGIQENELGPCLRGRLVHEPELRTSPVPFLRRLAGAGLGALVAAPMLAENRAFGIFFIARRQAGSFSSGECEFLRQLSEHVALAAHQAQLHLDLQRAYDDLRQTQQAVMQQERLRALGQMASGIAHDINNAISPVALYTESLLETEPNLSARARDYLGTIQHAIEDVAHTVSRMREFYRQREPQLLLAPVQLNPLVQQILDLSRARWLDMPQQRGVVIEVKTELAPALPPVMGIESEIREALVNLVFNAVDAMPEGGCLTLRTRLAPGGRSVAIEVADTGVGMSEDTRRRCLEPFFTTKGERGTGLGLAMVYGTVRRHNAEIEIESEVGRGTTFRLALPVAEPAARDGAAPAPAAVPKSLRLLVVDDDPMLIKSLRDILETDGHRVATADGGQAGIDAFRSAQARGEPFAVVLTDLGMPYVDGRRVASEVKSASPATPVILLTGWGQRLLTEGDIPPHVDRVLSKPPKLRELREALGKCLAEPAG